MADPRKEKRNRVSNNVMPQHEADAQILREKTARLRELRLAQGASAASPALASRRNSKKSRKPGEKNASLSDWLATQQDQGRRS